MLASIRDAMLNGTFFTKKHVAANIPTPDPEWLKTGRSVVTPKSEAKWPEFFDSKEFDAILYGQPKRKYPSSGLLTITPQNNKYIDVPGSGIPPKQLNPTHAQDTFVVVWGHLQGPHIYTESSSKIAADIAAGKLVSGRRIQ